MVSLFKALRTLITNTERDKRSRERERERNMQGLKGEVVLNIPAEKAWEMYRDNKIISQIKPEMLAHAEYVQGDGSPGSLRLLKLGPALQNYVTESTEKIEEVEESGCWVSYVVVGGELLKMYDPYKVTFTFTPLQGKEQHQCIAEWKAEYEALNSTIPPPEKAMDAALAFLKCFDQFEPTKTNYLALS
ncbi:uncharacterized protein LOC133817491 [Humulus lupulus]|uniref:uncharacterized protein LOC133817491 n=1 Tax=Humulus lupulus TaxID=3486 RepID=UPI002B40A037|nr:uncharacterized protein LOC133817491 [Humulus lupulus]